jgi:hypothetical protein
MRWCAASDTTWEAVRLPHAAIDVRHGEAYVLRVEGACQDNPHIAQTVPHRFSQNACTGRTLAQTSHALCDICVIHVGIVRKSWAQVPTADRVVEEPHDNR